MLERRLSSKNISRKFSNDIFHHQTAGHDYNINVKITTQKIAANFFGRVAKFNYFRMSLT